jgi:hypothetical protein
MNTIYLEGKIYKLEEDCYPGIIIIKNEMGIRNEFSIIDPILKEYFKFVYSQKRGTKWATLRLQ